ncbi:right-handed parallel beta-helix repeat-containing protein [Halalkalicoccus jeotgali]|nr:right-handed parallel beta-helix repeat-containing protein [Halalkalicoccus jeotgali]
MAFAGYGVISGCGLSIETGDLGTTNTLRFGGGSALVDGTVQEIDEQTIGVSTSDPDNPRRDLLIATPAGDLSIIPGTPEAAVEEADSGKRAVRPAPPAFSEFDGTPLWEIWVGSGVATISASAFENRRFELNSVFGSISAQEATVENAPESETGVARQAEIDTVAGQKAPKDGAGTATLENYSAIDTEELNNTIQAKPGDDLHAKLSEAAGGVLRITPGTHTSGGTKLTPPSDTTIISHGALIETQADEYLLDTEGADNVVIDGGTWDGTSQTGGQAYLSVVRLGETDGSEIRNAIVQNGGYYGLNIPESNNVRAHNVISRNHYRHGVRPQNQLDGAGKGYYLTNIESYGNGQVGVNVRYEATTEATVHLSNIRTHDNGNHGLHLIEDQGTITYDISDVRSWANTGRGLFVENGTLKATSVITSGNGGDSGILADGAEVEGTGLESLNDAGNGQTYRECDRVVLTTPRAIGSESNGVELRSNVYVDVTAPQCTDNGQSAYSAGININESGTKSADFIRIDGGQLTSNWQNVRSRADSPWMTLSDVDAQGSVDVDIDISLTDETNLTVRNCRGAQA